MSTADRPVLAVVGGRPLSSLPPSLFVPPEALRVYLETFEGPLDLLHYLIRRENIDILDIPMTEITRQYLAYVERIVDTQFDLAADYLLMSATLIEIKSRMLLPMHKADGEEEEDPRADLVRRLLDYSRIRAAAESLGERPRLYRDFLVAHVAPPRLPAGRPALSVRAMAMAMLAAEERFVQAPGLRLAKDTFSVREAMAHLMLRLRERGAELLSALLDRDHATRARVAVFFIAALQMAKDQLVRIVQTEGQVRIITRKR